MKTLFLLVPVLLLTLISLQPIVSSNASNTENILRVPQDFPTIQTAIDSAESGDTIKIEGGIYHEQLKIFKSINLLGEDTDSVIVKGISIQESVISIQGMGTEVTIFGMSISEGRVGIFVDISAKLSLKKINISKNRLGIHAQGSSIIRIEESAIHDNTGGGEPDLRGAAGGILLRDEAVAEVISTEIFKNRVTGVEVRDSSKLSIHNTKIMDHPSDGIFSTSESEVTVKDILIEGNGTGIEFLRSSQGIVVKSHISQQVSIGISISGQAKLKISDSKLTNNGNGVYASGQAFLEMSQNEVIENRNWGMLIYTEPCFQSVVTPKFEGIIIGKENRVSKNKKGDFCPSYPGIPWPNGFVSP